jgi:hypothetical protein
MASLGIRHRIGALMQTPWPLSRRAAAAIGEDRLHFGHDRERNLLRRLGAEVQAYRAVHPCQLRVRGSHASGGKVREQSPSSALRPQNTGIPDRRRQQGLQRSEILAGRRPRSPAYARRRAGTWNRGRSPRSPTQPHGRPATPARTREGCFRVHSSKNFSIVAEPAFHLPAKPTSRAACRAARATDSRSRRPVGVRALTMLGFAVALHSMSGQSERS